MNVRTKFNIVLSLLLLALFLALAGINYYQEQQLILKAAADNARMIARQIIETRDYLSASITNEPEQNSRLIPQVAATEIARRITKDSKFYVRQVSLRYRNPDNRPDKFESDHLRAFIDRRKVESFEVIPVNGKRSLRYMLAMVADKSCLTCHGSYDTAPRFVQRRFPPNHYSYGYRVGDIIGAVSVTVPIEELSRQVSRNFKTHILLDGTILIILAIVSSWLLRKSILNPIRKVSDGIRTVTKGNATGHTIPVTSTDEIGELIVSFNELHAELERKTLQRRESEDRYRNFIEIAQSPIVTFMTDGKILISNQKAETLLGINRQEILGQCIYDFMLNGDQLHQELAHYYTVGKSDFIGATVRQTLRDMCGRQFEVDMVISVSQSDHNPIFSAILRPTKK